MGSSLALLEGEPVSATGSEGPGPHPENPFADVLSRQGLPVVRGQCL